MKLEYTVYRLANTELSSADKEIRQILTAGERTFICTLVFDDDSISSTFGHWICTLDVVSDTEDIPERSLVLYPNTLHFEGDTIYTVAVSSSLESIGQGDLQDTFLTIGVPVNE